MRDSRLDICFEPLEMPNLTLKNRFYMAPMGTTFTMDQVEHYLAARARGGVALITTAEISVHPSGRGGGDFEPHLETDDDIKKIVPVVKAVQEGGAKIIAQLNHVGRYAHSRFTGQQSVAPSPIASRLTGETPRELSTQEVDDLVIAFAEAAVRARKAGFDGIELLGSSGYLISEFLSPLTNRREDKYGGDTLQKAIFLLNIIQETRNRVGNDYNICVKFDADDGMEGGKTLEDSLQLAPKFVEAGADRLHIWAGWHEATRPMLPMFVPRGAFSYLAAAIKNVVDVPVSTVGRINDPYVAADILAKGEADFIGLGRTVLCDPDFVKKAEEGRDNEIRRCIACCYCFDQIMGGVKKDGKMRSFGCAMNPELGREGDNLLQKAGEKKKVAVAGGGPAGLEAARVAALRGHEVTLYEEDKLGGMIHLACVPPHKEELKNIIDYYTAQMDVLPIDVKLGEVFTAEKLNEIKPDVVVLAAGAREFIPQIAGIEGQQAVTALDVLRGTAEVGENVVVVGGGLIGVETAEYLVDQGRKVTVIEMLKDVAADVGPTTRWGLLGRVYKKMKIMNLTKVIGIKEGQVVVEDPDKNRQEIPADTVVMAAGLSSRVGMKNRLDEAGVEYHEIGSGREPGQIHQAVAEGFNLGCKI
ncbi:FAD-dependent oxidoreductase [Thermodesulfobacteriota bacterium]